MTHTATPWTTRSEGPQWFVHQSGKEWGLICNTLHGNDQANAEFIVRAVNSHEELLEAVKAQVDEWHSNDLNFERREPQSLKLARAALAKAEGK